jgi:hypothetical protein
MRIACRRIELQCSNCGRNLSEGLGGDSSLEFEAYMRLVHVCGLRVWGCDQLSLFVDINYLPKRALQKPIGPSYIYLDRFLQIWGLIP